MLLTSLVLFSIGTLFGLASTAYWWMSADRKKAAKRCGLLVPIVDCLVLVGLAGIIWYLPT